MKKITITLTDEEYALYKAFAMYDLRKLTTWIKESMYEKLVEEVKKDEIKMDAYKEFRENYIEKRGE